MKVWISISEVYMVSVMVENIFGFSNLNRTISTLPYCRFSQKVSHRFLSSHLSCTRSWICIIQNFASRTLNRDLITGLMNEFLLLQIQALLKCVSDNFENGKADAWLHGSSVDGKLPGVGYHPSYSQLQLCAALCWALHIRPCCCKTKKQNFGKLSIK